MIVITKYRLEKDESDGHKIWVKSKEKSMCPVCLSETLKVIGSRHRGVLDSKGEKLIIVIRRLRCTTCKKIHHELPDILVPYKRYLSECIEAIIEGEHDRIACESSTIYRLKRWFKTMVPHIKGSLASAAAKINAKREESGEPFPKTIKAYVGDEVGWLRRAVRIVVNINNWIHTRFAFMA